MTFLPAPVLGVISMALFILNLTLWIIPFYIIAIIKLLVPVPAIRRLCTRGLEIIGETWTSCNKFMVKILQIDWDVRGADDLKYNDWYLISSNHQSWNDVFMLQTALSKRVPFPRFFLKQQLIWVPLLGLAWWALEMPFMKRHSRAEIEKNPALRMEDLETTRKACAVLREHPSAVINFLEGTRFTPEKQAAQNSPFKHLLKPKAGGLAFVLASLGDKMRNYLDITIAYPADFSFWDFMCGRMRKVIIKVNQRILPDWIFAGDYLNDEKFRKRFQVWVNELWVNKDAELAGLLKEMNVA
ncbi:MAG: acyltransferase [Gammaproteobacteria bacterium]|nr:acyltransferase [Gammaproteobacteria bacterium]